MSTQKELVLNDNAVANKSPNICLVAMNIYMIGKYIYNKFIGLP